MVFRRSGAISFTRLQVFSGLLPFHHLRSPVVACAVLRGERPGKPLNALSLGFTDVLWGLLQSCWEESAAVRPTARQLLDHLNMVSDTWVPPETFPAARGAVNNLSSDIFGVSEPSPSGAVCLVQ